ncbi:hypothetical protein MFC14_005229, partial [Klebsiella pneumoniae]
RRAGRRYKKGPQMRAYGCVVVSAQLSLKANRQIFIAALWAGINRYVLSPQSCFVPLTGTERSTLVCADPNCGPALKSLCAQLGHVSYAL